MRWYGIGVIHVTTKHMMSFCSDRSGGKIVWLVSMVELCRVHGFLCLTPFAFTVSVVVEIEVSHMESHAMACYLICPTPEQSHV